MKTWPTNYNVWKSGLISYFGLTNTLINNYNPVRAFTSRMLKIITFNNSKHYFIYFNIPLYYTPNIKGFIFFTTSLLLFFLLICVSSSLFLYISLLQLWRWITAQFANKHAAHHAIYQLIWQLTKNDQNLLESSKKWELKELLDLDKQLNFACSLQSRSEWKTGGGTMVDS